MKMIIAIVQRFMADDVVRALHAMPVVTGATLTDSRGFGRRRRGMGMGESVTDEAAKLRVEVVARDEDADAIAQVIRGAARTGNRGDGKIFILPIERAMRIADDEEGEGIV